MERKGIPTAEQVNKMPMDEKICQILKGLFLIWRIIVRITTFIFMQKRFCAKDI